MVHGVRSSTLFRRKRRGKVLDEVSTAIHGGEAAVNDKDNLMKKQTKYG
jgi:hypothetical protein